MKKLMVEKTCQLDHSAVGGWVYESMGRYVFGVSNK